VPITEVDKIWMNGELVDWRDAKIHVLSHGLHYGSGVFEGIRAYATARGPAVWHLDAHLDRMFASGAIYHMELPYSKEELIAATKELIRVNKLDSCYIRPIAFRGYGEMGVNPLNAPINVTIAVWPWGAYLGTEALEKGIRVKTSSFTHHHPNITMCNAKAVCNYAVSVLANHEATHDGYEEAMLLDPQGFVCQGSGENVFLVRDGKLHTPDLAGGALNGITRASIMTFAAELGIPVIERRITRDEFYIGDEAFFTGTAAEVTPIRELDNRPVGSGRRGPITQKLQTMFFDVVNGRNAKYKSWLTRVDSDADSTSHGATRGELAAHR
jgi:branched-chain amino acid aminotransferase